MTSPEASLRALGDKNRLLLLRLLLESQLSVGELTRISGLGQSLVSHHLAVLVRHGWVAGRQVGRQRIYQPNVGSGPLAVLAQWVKQQVPLPVNWQEAKPVETATDSRERRDLEDYLL